MRRRTGLALLPVLLLAGCGGSDPADDRREQVAALTGAANERDADGVRQRADALLSTVADQRERQEISAGEADRLIALAQAVRTGADVVDEDLLERRRAEAEAEAARQQLEEAREQLEEERKKAEESDRKADEEDRKKAEEEAKKAEEEAKKEAEKED